MNAALEILTCAVCPTKHSSEQSSYHKDVLLGQEGMHVICNSHTYDELVKEVA